MDILNKQLLKKKNRLRLIETVLLPEVEKTAIGERLSSIAVMGLDPVPSNKLIADYKKEKSQLKEEIYKMEHETICQGKAIVFEENQEPRFQLDFIKHFLDINYPDGFGFINVRGIARDCCKDLITKGFYGPDDYTERRIDNIRRQIDKIKNGK
jgi:hypothetical protein